MFYNFFYKRNQTSKITKVGKLTASRYHRKQFSLMQSVGCFSGSCLEIGPGDGIFAKMCSDHNIAYQAVDRSKDICDRMSENGIKIDLSNVPPLPYSDSQYDLVCAFHVLEHMSTYEQAIIFMEECVRVLNKGGKIAIEVPDFLRAGISFYAWDYTHSYPLTVTRLRQLFEDSGLHVLKIVELTGPVSSLMIRLPIDLFGFIIHSRFVYWFCRSIGLESVLHRIYKTIAPSILIIGEK